MDLSIIIVSWNVRDKLKKNLESLFKSKGDFVFEVIVVDNASKDGSSKMIKENFPNVSLISNDENLGFARACNQGLRQAQGRYALLLNPDMEAQEDALIKMIKWMDANPQANVAGCRLIDAKGETVKHVRRFPRLFDQLMIILKIPHLFPGVLNKYIISDFDYDKAQAVDSIRGSFFMIRNNIASRQNYLDERYFILFEEVDFCRQIHENGGEVWYTPAAIAVDCVGESFSQVNTLTKQKYFRDSQLKYFKKWQPKWQYWLLKLAWMPAIFVLRIKGK